MAFFLPFKSELTAKSLRIAIWLCRHNRRQIVREETRNFSYVKTNFRGIFPYRKTVAVTKIGGNNCAKFRCQMQSE